MSGQIVWLAQGKERYGVGVATLNLAMAMQRRGHSVLVICVSHGEFVDQCRDSGVPVEVLGIELAPNLGGQLSKRIQAIFELRRYEQIATKLLIAAIRASDKRTAVLQVIWPNYVGIAGKAAAAVGARAVWEMPNTVGTTIPLGLSRGYYQALCWRWGITVLANSRHTARSLGNWPIKPKVFHLGVDATRFDPDKVIPIHRAELNIPEDAIVLTIVARLTEDKGQPRIWNAILALGAKTQKVHLIVLGDPIDGQLAKSMLRRAKEAKAAHRLHLIGRVSDPQRYYAITDIAINSRLSPEPFGLSVVEAMMMRTPVLAYAAGGPSETIIDGKTGWLTKDSSQTGWEKAIERVLADNKDWINQQAAAQTHALTHYTADQQAQRYCTLLNL